MKKLRQWLNSNSINFLFNNSAIVGLTLVFLAIFWCMVGVVFNLNAIAAPFVFAFGMVGAVIAFMGIVQSITEDER